MLTPPELENLTEDQLLRHVLAASSDMVFVKNRACRLVWANRAFCDFYGMSLAQLRGVVDAERNQLNTARYLIDDARVFQNGETVEISEEPVVRHDRQTRWFHTVKTPVLGADGRPTLLVGVARDVTDMRANRLTLTRINECLLAFGSDSLVNISLLTSLCGELLGADYAYYNRVDKDILTSVGQWNVPEGFDPITPLRGSRCAEVIERAADAPVVAHEFGDGERLEASPRTYIGRAVKTGDRVLGSLCAIFRRDIDADAALAKVMGILASAIAVEEERLRGEKVRARLSDELRQANKMEAIGRMAGGIAHDFNNVLSAIKGYAEILASELKDEAQRADAAEIVKSADFAASLTRRLLAFERRQILVPRVIALDETLNEMAHMLKRLIGANIELIVIAPPARVYADPGQMEQIIVNLALNARDAMPEGGRLTLALAEVDAQILPKTEGPSPQGRFVELSACDTGCGIGPDVMPRIFEPFYTTKAPGKGTGLGLATIMDIVAQNHGRVACRSEPGKGATFLIYLPLSLTPPTPAPAPFTATALRGRGPVLLVEDDPGIRLLYARVLRAVGYQVSEAADATEAMGRAEELGPRLGTLITDVILPGMNGHQLAALLQRAHPDLKVLYMSGYTDEAIFRNALKPGVAFLQKPFSPSDLCRKLDEMLGV